MYLYNNEPVVVLQNNIRGFALVRNRSDEDIWVDVNELVIDKHVVVPPQMPPIAPNPPVPVPVVPPEVPSSTPEK